MHEVLALEFELVVFAPVAADGQHGVCATDERHHVRQRDAGGFAVFVLVFKALQVQVHVALIQGEALVVQVTKTRLFVLGLVDLTDRLVRLTNVHVQVEPGLLELDDLVLGLAHLVRDAVASLDVGGAVGQQDVFGRDKDRHLTVQTGVEVHLLER